MMPSQVLHATEFGLSLFDGMRLHATLILCKPNKPHYFSNAKWRFEFQSNRRNATMFFAVPEFKNNNIHTEILKPCESVCVSTLTWRKEKRLNLSTRNYSQ